ncbi:UNVERIFIED_CONTAM: hypothetical protein FKN15_075286, partial [Acipenser sinensis]
RIMYHIGTVNVNGCRDPFRRAQVISYLKKGGYSVCFLQETHTTPEAEANWLLEWGGRVSFSHLTSTSCGVATLFSGSFLPTVLDVVDVEPGRLLHHRIRDGDRIVHLVNVYAPSTGPARVQFFRRMSTYMNNISADECVVLGGDFNCTLEAADRVGGQEHYPLSSAALRELTAQLSLVDIWRWHHPDAPAFTFTRVREGRVSQSRIDRFYVTRNHAHCVRSSDIRPAPFTDHNLLAVAVALVPVGHASAYWHFNNALLEDERFERSFRDFWTVWHGRRSRFPTWRQWWDVGKAQIKIFCQEYTRGASRRRDSRIERLERELLDLESRLARGDQLEQSAYEEKKSTLRDLQLQRSRGAYVRSRIQFLREMDRGSHFFYALEKKKGDRRNITCLLADDGSLLTDPESVNERARAFYSDLFSPDPVDSDACRVLWDGLPTVGEGVREEFEGRLTLAELSGALSRMPYNKSPGIDGLTVEFFRKFWDLLGPAFARVLAEAYETGEMPLSMRRAVITLLPKKGDLRCLKNWRPVSLLCTDYKIVAKAASLRLKSVLADVIHPDQSYTVPNRTIFDNIFLVRDLLHYCKGTGRSVAFLSLDQEKAFDRVDHEYLFGTLRAFGFGPKFVGLFRMLYASAECLLKVNWSLTAPLAFRRGVRQGCPLSGQLYALCIEPFLCLLRRRLTGMALGAPDTRVVLSAYADDVLLVASDPVDLERMRSCQSVYSAASSARINWTKCSGLLVGPWRVDSLPAALQQFQWSADSFKYLGVHAKPSTSSLGTRREALPEACSPLLRQGRGQPLAASGGRGRRKRAFPRVHASAHVPASWWWYPGGRKKAPQSQSDCLGVPPLPATRAPALALPLRGGRIHPAETAEPMEEAPAERPKGREEPARAERALRVDPLPVTKETSEAGPDSTTEGPAAAEVAEGAQEGPPTEQLPRVPPSSDSDTGPETCVAGEGATEPAPEAEEGSAGNAEPMQATSAEGPEGEEEQYFKMQFGATPLSHSWLTGDTSDPERIHTDGGDEPSKDGSTRRLFNKIKGLNNGIQNRTRHLTPK